MLSSMALLAVGSGVCSLVWNCWMRPTRVALVNYPDYVVAPYLDDERDPFLQIDTVKWNEESGAELANYDAVYFFGMGLKFTPDQEKLIDSFAKSGPNVYVYASTRIEPAVETFPEEQGQMVKSCL